MAVATARPDATGRELARAAGADLVLELPRGGKIRAQDAAVRARPRRDVAFSDANAAWEPDALRAARRAVRRPARSATSAARCGSSTTAGTNQEGLYWRYEMWLRALESRAGVGHRPATARSTRSAASAYVEVDPIMGHDLSFPFNMVKRGWRAVYAPRRAGDARRWSRRSRASSRASGG